MQNEDHSSASYHESVPAQGGQERSGANRADELGSDEVPPGSTAENNPRARLNNPGSQPADTTDTPPLFFCIRSRADR